MALVGVAAAGALLALLDATRKSRAGLRRALLGVLDSFGLLSEQRPGSPRDEAAPASPPPAAARFFRASGSGRPAQKKKKQLGGRQRLPPGVVDDV